MTSLDRWRSLWQELGAVKADDELFHRLVACYSEPHRKYHTMQHLEECFAHFESVRSVAEHAGEVELALWFHDAIYNTKRQDNEERSAEWARDSALSGGLTADQASRIYELVMTTSHNALPVARDAMVLVDIDLGTDLAQIVEEYAAAPQFVIEGSFQFPVIRNTGPLVLRNDRNILMGVRYLFSATKRHKKSTQELGKRIDRNESSVEGGGAAEGVDRLIVS